LDIYWRPVLFTPNHEVIPCRKQGDTSEHGDVPVHSLRRDRTRDWEEAEDEEGDQEHERDNVDRHAPATEGEAGGG